MTPANNFLKLGELIDRIETIREELLTVQRSLERQEKPEDELREGESIRGVDFISGFGA